MQRKRSRADADRLIAEWPTITKIAGRRRVALYRTLHPDRELPTARERDDRVRVFEALEKQYERMIRSIKRFATSQAAFHVANNAKQIVAQLSDAIPDLVAAAHDMAELKRFWAAMPLTTARSRSGPQHWIAERAVLEVVAAFFKSNGWPVSQDQSGLYAAVAFIILPGERTSMNAKRLRALATFEEPYVKLRAAAPKKVT